MIHYLKLVSVTEAGSRFDCPDCGRIMVIVSCDPPRKRVLIPGEDVMHLFNMGKAGMQVEVPIVVEANNDN